MRRDELFQIELTCRSQDLIASLRRYLHRRPCPYRKSNPDVLMVQTSEVWGGHDTANGLHSTRRWCILVQR